MKQLGCFCYLVNHTDQAIKDCIKSLQLLTNNYLVKYPTPIILFHEHNLTNEMKHVLYSINPSLINFIPVEFKTPEHIGETVTIDNITVKSGYMNMCKFFANEIFYHPVLSEYEYYCRLDTDSFILSPIPCNIFEQSKNNNINYGFINDRLYDNPSFFKELWPLAQKFITDNNIPVYKKLYSEIQEGRIFYNNFEICYLDWFKQGIYPEFFKVIDKDGGIYRRRWGDYIIRYIGVNSFMHPNQIGRLNINYSHQGIGK